MEHKNNCLLCGAELIYEKIPVKRTCAVCGGEFETTVACQQGHYVCDQCHTGKAEGVILAVCRNTPEKNPYAILRQLMEQPCIHMHGPEHHILVGAALLAAFRNCGGQVDLDTALPEMVRRGKQVPGGACGAWGCCGAGVSTGIFVSLVTGTTPLSGESWGLSIQMTAKALEDIGKLGGPRCCKRDSYTAVLAAAKFAEEHFGVRMELPERIICGFSPLNSQCRKTDCPYYPQETDKC